MDDSVQFLKTVGFLHKPIVYCGVQADARGTQVGQKLPKALQICKT